MIKLEDLKNVYYVSKDEDYLLDQANEYVAENGDATPKELSQALNITIEKAKNLLNMLRI
jgi:predicted HTH transcriptional regulator